MAEDWFAQNAPQQAAQAAPPPQGDWFAQNAPKAEPPRPGIKRPSTPPALRSKEEQAAREAEGIRWKGPDGKVQYAPSPKNPYAEATNPLATIDKGAQKISRVSLPGLTANERGKAAAGGAHEVLGGVMELSTPFIAAEAATAKSVLPIAKALIAGTITKEASDAALKKMGVPEEYSEFLSDILGLGGAERGSKFTPKTEVGPILKPKISPEELEQVHEVERRGVQTTAGQKTGNKAVQSGEKAAQYVIGSSGRSQDFFERQAQQTRSALERVPEKIPAYRAEETPPGAKVKTQRILPEERSASVMESLPEISGRAAESRVEGRGLAAKGFGEKIYKRIDSKVEDHLKTEAPKRYERDLAEYRKQRDQYGKDFQKYGEDLDKYEAATQNGDTIVPERPIEPARPTAPRMMKYGAELDVVKAQADLRDFHAEMDHALPVAVKDNSPGWQALDQLMKVKEPVVDALAFDKNLSAIKSLMRSERGRFANSKSFRYAAETVSRLEDHLTRSLNRVDPRLVGELRRARSAWKTYRETDDLLRKLMPFNGKGEPPSPRLIYDKLTAPRGVDKPTIDRLKEIAPNEVKGIAEAYIRGMVEKSTATGGARRLQALAEQFRTMDNGVKSSLFGKDFTKSLQTFLDGATRLGLEENSSGTAKWKIVTQAMGLVGAAFETLILGHPIGATAAAIPVAMNLLARLMFTEKGIRFLTDTIEYPLGSPTQLRAATELGKLARAQAPEQPPPGAGGSAPPLGSTPGGSPPPSGGAPSAAGPETPPPGAKPAKPALTSQARWQADRRAAPSQYVPIIEKAAADYGIESGLLTALLRQESAFNPNAVSKKGAEGIAQFMKGTAKQMGLSDSFNPEEAIPAAAKLLAALRDQFNGDMQLAVAAYNAGAGAVRRVGGDIAKLPEETQDYVKRIFNRLRGEQPAVVKGEAPPPGAKRPESPAESPKRPESPVAETKPPGAVNNPDNFFNKTAVSDAAREYPDLSPEEQREVAKRRTALQWKDEWDDDALARKSYGKDEKSATDEPKIIGYTNAPTIGENLTREITEKPNGPSDKPVYSVKVSDLISRDETSIPGYVKDRRSVIDEFKEKDPETVPPLLVSKDPNNPGKFIVQNGTKRLVAARESGIAEVPVVISDAYGKGGPGVTGYVYTPTNIKAKVRYDIVDAFKDVRTSSQEGYNQDYQNRNIDTESSRATISDIETGLNPELLGESKSSTDGAPIGYQDSPDVLAGNHRVEGIRGAYEKKLAGAKALRQDMIEKAAKYGKTPEEVAQMRGPMLKATILDKWTPEQIKKFAEDSNAPTVQVLSPQEYAKQLAGRLTPKMLESLDVDESGMPSPGFVRALLADIPKTLRNTFMDAEGELSPNGAKVIQNILFRKAFDDPKSDVLGRLIDTTNVSIKNVGTGMFKAAPDFIQLQEAINKGTAYPVNPTKEIQSAAEILDSLRKSKKDIQMYLDQNSMTEVDPLTMRFMEIFNEFKRSGKKISEVLKAYADIAQSPELAKNQNALPGMELPDPEKADILEAAYARVKDRYAEQPPEPEDEGELEGKVSGAREPEGSGEAQEPPPPGAKKPKQVKGKSASAASGETPPPGAKKAKTPKPSDTEEVETNVVKAKDGSAKVYVGKDQYGTVEPDQPNFPSGFVARRLDGTLVGQPMYDSQDEAVEALFVDWENRDSYNDAYAPDTRPSATKGAGRNPLR